jgi:hypothetical protein
MKTRTQTGRIVRTMEKTLYYEQHGFCRNRGIATAMVPLLETICTRRRKKCKDITTFIHRFFGSFLGEMLCGEAARDPPSLPPRASTFNIGSDPA